MLVIRKVAIDVMKEKAEGNRFDVLKSDVEPNSYFVDGIVADGASPNWENRVGEAKRHGIECRGDDHEVERDLWLW